MARLTKPLMIRVTPELAAALRAMTSWSKHRTLSAYLREVLERHVAEERGREI